METELLRAVERLVSEHFGRAWSAREHRDLREYASHPAALLSDGSHSVFVKQSDAPDGPDQFETELAGLRLLSERAGVLTPTPIGIVSLDGRVALVLEGVEPVEPTPRGWREIGRALARIHRVKGDRFGLDRQGYFGPLHQDNRPMDDWPTFYAERRLRPRLRGAVDSGNLPPVAARRVETLISRLPDLGLPETVPTLLHGDAQRNNFILTRAGAVVIDPAVFYGHPELDLALVDYFQDVPDDVFDGYRETMPIDPGFAERRDLWRVFAWLAVVEVEGADYLDRLERALRRYL